MYLYKSICKNPKVYISENYRDHNKITRRRIIKDCGYVSDLIEKYGDNYKEVLMNEIQKITEDNKIQICLELSKPKENNTVLNYGYFFIDKFYKQLKIDTFIYEISKEYQFKYDLNNIMKLLIFSRILKPESKLKTWENRNKFFESFDVDLKDIYRSLNVMCNIKEDLQLHIHKQITDKYGRDCHLMFYDVTNYYFETDYDDEDIINNETGEVQQGFRKKGVCKSNTQKPLVAMGLLIDRNGIPVAYKLFKGNTSDSNTLIPVLSELKEKYGIERVITTADKGLNSGNNLGFITLNNDGYIVSQKIRGSNKEFIDIVLNQEGYIYNQSKTHKSKSIIREREIKFSGIVNGKIYENEPVKLKEKVVIFWSKDYDDRMKYKRKDLSLKIEKYKENPSLFKAGNTYGIKRYFKTKEIDEKTGKEVKGKTKLIFDEEKYNRDMALDGYYAIITSEINLSNNEIISRYRGLSEIEDSFRVLKSDLEGRPVYVRLKDHIEGHFLICYISLVITRLLQYELNKNNSKKEPKVSPQKIQEALNLATCKNIGSGIYSLNKSTETLEKLLLYNDITLTEYMRYEVINNKRKKIIYNRK